MAVQPDEGTDQVAVTRRLFKSGNSTVLTIPPDILDRAELEQDDEIGFAVTDDGEVILREAPEA